MVEFDPEPARSEPDDIEGLFIALLIACAIGFGIDQLALLRDSYVRFSAPDEGSFAVVGFLIALNAPIVAVVVCPVIVLACWLMGSLRASWRSWRGRPRLIDKEVFDVLSYWNHAGQLLTALAIATAWPFWLNALAGRILEGAWFNASTRSLGAAFLFYFALMPSSLIGLLLARQATAMRVPASLPEPGHSRTGGIVSATLTCTVYLTTLLVPLLLLPRAVSNVYWLGDNVFDRLVLAFLALVVMLIVATRWLCSRARA